MKSQAISDVAARLEKELQSIHGDKVFVAWTEAPNSLLVCSDDKTILAAVPDKVDGFPVRKSGIPKAGG